MKKSPARAVDHDERLWRVEDVAVLLDVTRKGVYGLVETRRIPFIRLPGRGTRPGPIRFVRAELLEWVGRNRVPTLE